MEFLRERKLNELISCMNNGMIKIVTGVRRCGKSYLLNNMFFNYLLSQGFEEKNIIKFAFDLDKDIDKLDSFFPDEPTKIAIKGKKNKYVINSKKFRAYISSITKKEEKYFLILDEVQELENFVGTLNGFVSDPNFDVYVTGSNSKFLSSDIATEFRGRGDTIYLQPLTFKEIYVAKGGEKRELLDEYLKYGGLPLCVLTSNPERKVNYLNEVFLTTYLKDLVDRNRIKNIRQFNELIKILSSCIGSLTNPEKIMNTFRSKENTNINAATIKKYINEMENAFLLKECMRYDVKGRKYISSLCKYYFSDLGVRNVILNFRQYEKTHLMENCLFNELIYRGYSVDVGKVVTYKKTDNKQVRLDYECDFVCNKGFERIYIQSAYSIEDIEKKEQEEKSFDLIKDGFQKIIVVYDSVEPYRNEKGYIVVGLLQFLLNENFLK